MSSSLDVVIVGSGVIGASAAFELASRGADVTVLDMRSPGRGASQASAGILAPFTEAQRSGRILDLGRRSLDLWDSFVERVREASGREVEYARTGTLEVAFDADERRRLLDVKAWLDDEGEPAVWLEPSALRAFEPTVADEALGGLHVEHHGFVDVRALMAALVQAARLAGATFEDGVEVVSIDPGEQSVNIRTKDGRTIDADVAVMASGSWTNRIRVRGATLPVVKPIRGQLLRLRAPAGSQPARVVWRSCCYAVPWRDGTLLVGATVEDVGFDEMTSAAGVQELLAAVTRLLPAFARASLEAVHVGLRPESADGVPAIGPLAGTPRVIAATGHFRNGILLAPLTAELVADEVWRYGH